MLKQPDTCQGCALKGVGQGFMRPDLPPDGYGVALVGEALGEREMKEGAPFRGPAGFNLTRLLQWAGLDRGRFDIWNTVWCQPPNNYLDGASYEAAAINHCRSYHWVDLIDRVKVIVPMGNVALNAMCGKKGILGERGYVRPGPHTTHLVPTVHPSFIRRGQSKYSAAFINDVQKAVQLAQTGLPIQQVNYVIDPSPSEALVWANQYRQYLDTHPDAKLAYDIETPSKGLDEGLLEVDDPTYFIWRIGFSYLPHTALTVPWTPEYMQAIRTILESDGEKVVWNAAFDNPRISYNGVRIGGLVHDGMVAWHILQSNLPKGLGFVATFTCPWQPAWKHLSTKSPGFYNCTDADVELRSMIAIEKGLRVNGLWEVYQRDVLDLDPILIHMTQEGMPIDKEIREDRARKLADALSTSLSTMERLVPIEARKLEPKHKDGTYGYIRTPPDTTDMVTISVRASVRRCSVCGQVNPLKPHFKRYKKPTAARPQNPCADGGVVEALEDVERYAKLAPLSTHYTQLVRYQEVMKRSVPTKWDKRTGTRRVSMDEKAIKDLMRQFPDDKLYPEVLEYRALDKLAGTYIGRPSDE